MDKNYTPENFETEIYKFWKEKNYFKAVRDSRPKFSVFMPPPNVTGRAHLGHALNSVIIDIMVRFKRMKGFNSLWIPGTDHAAIATEAKLVESIKAEGLTKELVGREEFIRRGWDWYRKYGGIIISQLERVGISPDWDRTAFTMDDNLSYAVKSVFVKYFNEGLIYRSERVVNWCPNCVSAISDIENTYVEQNTKLWYIRYPLADGSGGVTIATTRPETMFGDTAVAVNPNDERYKKLIGKDLILPLAGRKIKIIADEYSEMGFGTGAVKITPAHDVNDYKLGMKHGLEIISCIDDKGNLTAAAGEFEGLGRLEAREKIEAKLRREGFLVKVEKYKNKVGTCDRCHEITEPKISTQWFVKMKELARPAIEACKSGEFKCNPLRFNKQYLDWLNNINDWCISRQLWLGHRIPVFTCKSCGNVEASIHEVEICAKCGSVEIEQDPDVLDTWFSSALWPFSTLGWTGKTNEVNEDLSYYYPYDFMATAPEILYLWVARMMFSGIKFVGKPPFPLCILTGTVLDSKGKKMSKNLGNGINPIEMAEKYGADALRFSLIYGTSFGKNIKYNEDRAKDAKVFINKLYNAGKFVIKNLEGFSPIDLKRAILSLKDRWILTEYENLVKEVTRRLNKFEEPLTLARLSEFIVDIFCDWYIELAKVSLAKEKIETQNVLFTVFEGILKLIHPFIPFVTEEIYRNLPIHDESIMKAQFPEFDLKLSFKDGGKFDKILNAIRAIRNIRAKHKVPDNKRSKIYIETKESIYLDNLEYIVKLGFGTSAEIVYSSPSEPTAEIILHDARIYLSLGELMSEEKRREKLEAEVVALNFEIERSCKLLSNEGFMKKAPKKLIDVEKEKLKSNREKLNLLTERL